MKFTTQILAAALLTGLAAGVLGAADQRLEKKARPYPLKTCVVSGEEINEKGDMKPYTFVHEGQEVKLCCKSCLKDFNKEPAKYLKKIQ